MTAKQIALAVAIARGVPPDADDRPLHGLCTPEFACPVVVTLEAVAVFLRWQCLQFNGGWDEEECNRLVPALRRKVVTTI